ncbi:MAG: hypothetical protein RDU20_23785, partial [Desulfomonilaceae bacterium]|nr:hypothetical protein [Desulfomonilaceae bacterium]
MYYWMALHLIPGIGGVTYRQLIKVFGTPEEVFKAKGTELTAIKGIRSATIEAIRNFASKERAAQELKLLRKYGVKILTFQDKAYPQNLANIYDAPALLYIK